MDNSMKSKTVEITVEFEHPLVTSILTQGMKFLKGMSLVLLTLQNAVLNIMMRLSRTQKELFLSSTAVVMSEMIKLFLSLLMVYGEYNDVKLFLSSLKKEIISQPIEIFKVAIPSFVYLLQNNLLYVGATHLDASTCQVTYQLKILTTALFSVAMLNKKLNPYQWTSLCTLFAGIALVQYAQFDTYQPVVFGREQKPLIGFVAIVVACCMSGFAGVYFEKILKGSKTSVWMRNVQLCVSSIPLGFGTIFVMDWAEVSSKGFFYGYNLHVWIVVLLQALGGIIVAMVVKFADNILKGFSTSIAIVLSCVLNVYFFHFQLTFKFVVGASLVIGSIFLYAKQYQPIKK